MAYSPKAVANYFLDLAKKEGMSLDQMKLQKLVFFAHGWYLYNYKTSLLNERPQAWKFGPVLPTLYAEFRSFGNSPIDRLATDIEWEGLSIKSVIPQIDQDDKKTISLLNLVWATYGKFSGVALSNLTHLDGTPWKKTYQPDTRFKEIQDEVVIEYFDELVKKQAK